MSLFQPATREKLKLRLALVGPTGSGKSYTALRVAAAITKRLGGKIAAADTEHGSLSKYVGEVDNDGNRFDFDVVNLGEMAGRFSVENYIRVIRGAIDAGYTVLIIDSLSHAWAGPGGLLEFVDKQAKRNRGNSFAGWRDATPLHNSLIDEMLAAPIHLIVTMRVKTEWVVEQNDRGKNAPRKIGMAPVQRDGLEYEFDVVGDMEADTHNLIITKSRCSAVADKVINKPGQLFADALIDWLEAGDEPAAPPPPPPTWNEIEPIWRDRLASAGLDYDGSVRAFLATRTKAQKLPEHMGADERDQALAWLCGDGANRVRALEEQLRGDLRRKFMARWSKLYPIPTQRDGATKEEQDAAKARSDKHRGICMQLWWGVNSLSKVTPEQILNDRKGRTLVWVERSHDFASEVDAALLNAALLNAGITADDNPAPAAIDDPPPRDRPHTPISQSPGMPNPDNGHGAGDEFPGSDYDDLAGYANPYDSSDSSDG